VVVTIGVQNSGGSDSKELSIDVRTPTPFQEWLQGWGITGNVNPADDLDGDGYSYSDEFAFGTNPTKKDSYLATVTVSPSKITLLWQGRKDASATYSLQRSTNLADWTAISLGSLPAGSSIKRGVDADPRAPEVNYEWIKVEVPVLTGQSAEFYRVHALVSPLASQ
jgi:hypothetical protein